MTPTIRESGSTNMKLSTRSNPGTQNTPRKRNPLNHLLAGGIAGLVESSCCHPFDTVKTRMQLTSNITNIPTTSSNCTRMGPLQTGMHMIRHEPSGVRSLYKGLTAVYTGIVPKMALRFFSFELYRDSLASYFGCGKTTTVTFFAGLASGVTEAILVVTPAEVCKIRMQACSPHYSPTSSFAGKVSSSNANTNSTYSRNQGNLLPELQKVRYHSTSTGNVLSTAKTIIAQEGIGGLYKGVIPTMMRQGCNQAANFTAYTNIKHVWSQHNAKNGRSGELKPWHHMLIGGISGGFGPVINNPIDVVKTRLQRQVVQPGHSMKYKGLIQSIQLIAKEEGILALFNGLSARLLRIMPGQAITFMTFEAASQKLANIGLVSS